MVASVGGKRREESEVDLIKVLNTFKTSTKKMRGCTLVRTKTNAREKERKSVKNPLILMYAFGTKKATTLLHLDRVRPVRVTR